MKHNQTPEAPRSPGWDELLRRAHELHLPQTRLQVEYYRIRYRLHFPIPVGSPFPLPEGIPLRFPSDLRYPWGIWLAWALEERLRVLGAGAAADESCRAAAAVELAALAEWPQFHQYENRPDLMPAHFASLFATALQDWVWIDRDLRASLKSAALRLGAQRRPVVDRHFAGHMTRESILHAEDPDHWLHNIPLIEGLALGRLMLVLGEDGAPEWNEPVFARMQALLDYRETGFTEGAAYDGYVLDFAADWLTALPPLAARPLLQHPRLEDCFDQSCLLAAPGNLAEVAQLGDVEPRRMAFHLSAQIKLQHLRPTGPRAWFIERLPLDWLPAGCLPRLEGLPDIPPAMPPRGASETSYAAVLRSGYEKDDLTVAAALPRTKMGHIHADAGSLVLATAGRWLVADPGYQQYLETSERQFTLGVAAHNHPQVNGCSASLKRPALLGLESTATGAALRLDLTRCYPEEARVTQLYRNLQLDGRTRLTVQDIIEAEGAAAVETVWHFHEHAAFAFAAGGVRLYWDDLPGLELEVRCDACPLEETLLRRLPGSRGQLSLVVPLPVGVTTVVWTFLVHRTGAVDPARSSL